MAAVIAGLASAGVDVLDVGVLPTPAIAHLTASLEADLGVVLSASHNPMPDNGIKFFTRGGHKLPDELEDAIEARLREPWERPTGAGVGRVRRLHDGAERYVTHLLTVLPHRLDGVHVVIDAAHGAASLVSPEVFRRAGARVDVIGAEPDGLNINDGHGSTHLTPLRDAVLAAGADLGIAHDGDADRCLAIDASGEVVDGDQIMAVIALALRERGALKDDTLVATVMSNLGMLQAMAREGVTVRQTAVGDRYVLEDMRAGGTRSVVSSPATSSCSSTARPATGCSPGCCWRRGWPRPGARWPTWPGSCAACRRCSSTCRGSTRTPSTVMTPCRLRWRQPRPSSARPGVCSCASPARSPWSASWSRPPMRPRPRRSPADWPSRCARTSA